MQPVLGGLLLAALLGLPFVYSSLGYTPQGGFPVFGVAFGVVFQRSRFCPVRGFREPFLTTGDSRISVAPRANTPAMASVTRDSSPHRADEGTEGIGATGPGTREPRRGNTPLLRIGHAGQDCGTSGSRTTTPSLFAAISFPPIVMPT
jgi:hypothetical protein